MKLDNKIIKYKPKKESFDDQYRYLINTPEEKLIYDNRLDGIAYLTSKRRWNRISLKILFESCSENKILKILNNDIIGSKFRSLPSIAEEFSMFNVLIWLENNSNTLNIDNSDNSLCRRRYDIAKWLAIRNIYPTTKSIYHIATYGDIDDIKWWINLGLPIDGMMKYAILSNRYKIIEILIKNNVVIDLDDINRNIQYIQLSTLKKIYYLYNIYPDINGANIAAKNGRLDIVKWLNDTFDITPHYYIRFIVNSITKDDYVTFDIDVDGTIEWLNMKVTDMLNILAGEGNINNLEKEIFKLNADRVKYTNNSSIDLPNTNGANLAANNCHINMLNWLEFRGITPNEDAGKYAYENNNNDVLQWLINETIW